MKIIVTQYSFTDAFRACGRGTQFSQAALRALFEHFENIEEWTDTELTLDPIGICCDWAEYPSALKAAKDYGFQDGIDSKDESALEWIENRTQVVPFDGGVIIRNF